MKKTYGGKRKGAGRPLGSGELNCGEAKTMRVPLVVFAEVEAFKNEKINQHKKGNHE